jgi:hypothetical protein
MGNMSKDPELPPSHAKAAEAFGMPPEPSEGSRNSDRGLQERRPGLWMRLKAWFARPAPKRGGALSNVTNPDDRRWIPRR